MSDRAKLYFLFILNFIPAHVDCHNARPWYSNGNVPFAAAIKGKDGRAIQTFVILPVHGGLMRLSSFTRYRPLKPSESVSYNKPP